MRESASVLIVDDRVIVRNTIRDTLRGFDCEFTEAQDGGEALTFLSTNAFDVIFLDLMLPDISGIDILRRSLQLGLALGKVIVLTGFPDLATLSDAKDLGAFRCLTKNPIDWMEVRRAFTDALVESGKSYAAPILPQGETTSNSTGRETRPAGVDMVKRAGARGALRRRLLVLDDDRLWLDRIKGVLDPEFDLILTTNIDEACRLVSTGDFALVVLDLWLSGGAKGLDVLSRMRRAVPTLQAIILTGDPDFPTAFESARRGALDYVSKTQLSTIAGTIKLILSQSAKRVFLSYDKTDRDRVSPIFDKLVDHGFLPWMDYKSIEAGKEWESEIEKAIEESDYFIFCLSRNSLYKEGMIRREVKQALKRQEGLLEDTVFFIPLRLEECESIKPFNRFQYVDYFEPDGFAFLLRTLSSSAPENIPRGEKRRMLVVDNSPAWLHTIDLMLAGKYELRLTSDPSRAVSLAESEPFALAILDQRMGETTGKAVLAKLRKIQPDMRAIILTGYAEVEDAVESMKIGAFDYISKGRPDLESELQRSIEKAFTRDQAVDQIASLIAKGESTAVEFKTSVRWDFRLHKVNREIEGAIVKTVAAFLNSDNGGILLIGVDDSGKVVGLEQDYGTLKKQNRDGFENFLVTLLLGSYGKDMSPLIQIDFHSIDGKDVCRTFARPAHRAVFVPDGTGGEHLYIRTGNSTRQLSTKEAIEYCKVRWK